MTLAYVAMLDYARQTAEQTAKYITEAARYSPGPVAWVTSNSYMPPARDFAGAEVIYQADLDLWELYWEAVEKHLDTAEVTTVVPDFDNAIYAVDLKRWQHVDSDDLGDSLNDEWEPIES